MNKQYKLAFVIMRAQFPTVAHFALLERAHKEAQNVIVMLGSANKAPCPKNPFSVDERTALLRAGLGSVEQMSTHFVGLDDYDHMNYEWKTAVNKIINSRRMTFGITSPNEITMVAYKKDASSAYVDDFPQYGKAFIEYQGDVNATDLRELWYKNAPDSMYEGKTPCAVLKKLRDMVRKTELGKKLAYLREQVQAIRDFKKPYMGLPYGIKFQTSDPVVFCDDYVLMIKRGRENEDVPSYGEDLWALPGGFVNQFESAQDALYRELNEETTIDVPERVLRISNKGWLNIQGANREDERGDFTTNVGIIRIESNKNGIPPKVTANSDAKEAKWIPISKLTSMRGEIFLDHAAIIELARRKMQLDSMLIEPI